MSREWSQTLFSGAQKQNVGHWVQTEIWNSHLNMKESIFTEMKDDWALEKTA